MRFRPLILKLALVCIDRLSLLRMNVEARANPNKEGGWGVEAVGGLLWILPHIVYTAIVRITRRLS